MGEVTSNGGRNFDLNMGPGLDSVTIPIIDETMILDDWSIDEPFIRFWQQQQVPLPFHQIELTDDDLQGMQIEPTDLTLNLDLPLAYSGNGSELQVGEGSIADEERPKACEIRNDGAALGKTSEKKEDVEKGSGGRDDAGFFDCNICFDMAKDPIVTCCGHLFCWPCIYRWLDMESKFIKGCPVCKGEVSIKSVTPIYGCGNDAKVHEEEEESNLNIPLRPNAKRIERRRLNLNLELVLPYELDNASQGVERAVRGNSMFQRAQGNSIMYAAERLGRNQENPPLVDDRDSFSSIAAVANSESQVDTGAGAENFLSTSSSRRRNDASSSNLSDVDSGDSPSPMRRRLN